MSQITSHLMQHSFFFIHIYSEMCHIIGHYVSPKDRNATYCIRDEVKVITQKLFLIFTFNKKKNIRLLLTIQTVTCIPCF